VGHLRQHSRTCEGHAPTQPTLNTSSTGSSGCSRSSSVTKGHLSPDAAFWMRQTQAKLRSQCYVTITKCRMPAAATQLPNLIKITMFTKRAVTKLRKLSFYLHQSTPAYDLTHGCITMLLVSQGCEQWRTQKISERGAKFRHNCVTSQINFWESDPGSCPRENFAKLHLNIRIFVHSGSKF